MKKMVMAVAATALIGLASPGLASGSGGGAGGGFGGGGVPGANNSQARELARLVRRGRTQVKKRITCKTCELHKQLNKDNALQVARNVINGQYGIKEKDRQAVLLYLRDRYKL